MAASTTSDLLPCLFLIITHKGNRFQVVPGQKVIIPISTGILITLLLSLLAACSPQSQSNSTSDFFATPAPIVVPEPVEQTNKSLKIYYSDYASMPMMDAAVQLY